MSKRICDGCRSDIINCALKNSLISSENKCPCSSCIVKSTCNKLCDEFTRYAFKVFRRDYSTETRK
jgi:hypothetical protein